MNTEDVKYYLRGRKGRVLVEGTATIEKTEDDKKIANIRFKDGSTYVGEFVRESLDDVEEKADGWEKTKKEVSWKSIIPHGEGKTVNNKGVYEGKYEDGFYHGKGVFEFNRNDDLSHEGGGELRKAMIDGEWKFGEVNGKATIYFENGGMYKGDWANGKMHGKGKHYFSGGSIYSGEYEKGKAWGEGISKFPDGKRFYGRHEDGKLVGKVEFYEINKDEVLVVRNLEYDIFGKLVKSEEPKEFDEGYEREKREKFKEYSDEEVIQEVKEKGVHCLRFATKVQRNSKKIFLVAAEINGFAIRYASEELRRNREIVLAAVHFGSALQFADQSLREDLGIVKKSVESDGTSIEFAGEEMRKQKDVVLVACRQSGPQALEFASEELKEDWEVLCTVARYCVNSGQRRLGEKYFQDAKNLDVTNDVYNKIMQLYNIVLQDKDELRVLESACIAQRSRIEGRTSEEVERIRKIFYRIKTKVKGKEVKCGVFRGISEKYLARLKVKEEEDMQKLRRSLKKAICKEGPGGSEVETLENIELMFMVGKGAEGITFACKIKGREDLGMFVLKAFKNSTNKEILNSKHLTYHENLVSILYCTKEEVEVNVSLCPDYTNWAFHENRRKASDIFKPIFTSKVVFMKFHYKDLKTFRKTRMDKMTLRKTRKRKREEMIMDSEAARIIIGVLRGAKELHKNNSVHRDLHEGNVFIDEVNSRVWIGDYGQMLKLEKKDDFKVNLGDKRLSESEGAYSSVYCNLGGAKKCLPPEVKDEKIYKRKEMVDYRKCDLYSIGVLGVFLMGFELEEKKNKILVVPSDEYRDEVMRRDKAARKNLDKIYAKMNLRHQAPKLKDYVPKKPSILPILQGLVEHNPKKRWDYKEAIRRLEDFIQTTRSREMAEKNLEHFGRHLKLGRLQYDENNTCILGIDDKFSMHLTFEPNSNRLYMYSPLLDGLPRNPNVKLRLCMKLLEGGMLGGQLAGGGVGLADEEGLVLMHCILDMKSARKDELTNFAPLYVQTVENWRKIVEDICVYDPWWRSNKRRSNRRNGMKSDLISAKRKKSYPESLLQKAIKKDMKKVEKKLEDGEKLKKNRKSLAHRKFLVKKKNKASDSEETEGEDDTDEEDIYAEINTSRESNSSDESGPEFFEEEEEEVMEEYIAGDGMSAQDLARRLGTTVKEQEILMDESISIYRGRRSEEKHPMLKLPLEAKMKSLDQIEVMRREEDLLRRKKMVEELKKMLKLYENTNEKLIQDRDVKEDVLVEIGKYNHDLRKEKEKNEEIIQKQQKERENLVETLEKTKENQHREVSLMKKQKETLFIQLEQTKKKFNDLCQEIQEKENVSILQRILLTYGSKMKKIVEDLGFKYDKYLVLSLLIKYDGDTTRVINELLRRDAKKKDEKRSIEMFQNILSDKRLVAIKDFKESDNVLFVKQEKIWVAVSVSNENERKQRLILHEDAAVGLKLREDAKCFVGLLTTVPKVVSTEGKDDAFEKDLLKKFKGCDCFVAFVGPVSEEDVY